MDGVRIAAGWVRELQGRWLGHHWGRLEVGGRSSRRIGPSAHAGLRCAGCAREYAAGNSADRGGTTLREKLGQLQAGSQAGSGMAHSRAMARVNFLPTANAGEDQGKAARRAGDPSPPSERRTAALRVLVVAIRSPRPMRAVQRARLCAILPVPASHGAVGGELPSSGMWFSPTPTSRSAIASRSDVAAMIPPVPASSPPESVMKP